MMKFLVIFFVIAASSTCDTAAEPEFSSASPRSQTDNPPALEEEAPLAATEPILPIPQSIEVDEEKVELGRKLFHDPLLSKDGVISCASCHLMDRGGADGRAYPIGVDGQKVGINSPTVFNLVYNFRLNWNGSGKTLYEQLDLPIENPKAMGASYDEILAKLEQSEEYQKLFSAVFEDGVSKRNFKDAIVEFEKSLITPNAPFDRWLRGDEGALSEDELEGYRIFKSYGCASCHQGVNAGGNLYQKFGVIGDYFADRGNVVKADLGRFNVTKKDKDKHVFRVPSLRNVALTAPYFHDGSGETLSDAVDVMAHYQLGRPLTTEEVSKIVAFLKTLTGELEGASSDE